MDGNILTKVFFFFQGGKSYEELKKALGNAASPVLVAPVRMRSLANELREWVQCEVMLL